MVELLGGVYADINFVFNRDTTSEVHKYNFFTMTYSGILLDNFFFGSSAKHPILERILELVERNLLMPPHYIRRIEGPSRITDLSTANPTYLAYYLKANQNGNIDVVYPSSEDYQDFKKYQNLDKHYFSPLKGEEELEKILDKVCPMKKAFRYIRSRNICGSEVHFIGRDGDNGGTWISSDE